MNRSIIVRLFAAICLIMVTACPGWADSNIIRPLIGNEILGSRDIISGITEQIIEPMPIFAYQPDKSWISAHASGLKSTTYARTSAQTYVDSDGVLRIAPANTPAIGRYGVELEGAATSYYWQPYTSASGIITSIEAPVTRTVTLPATGSYVLWIDGNSSLSVTIAANTAAGSGWGTLTKSGALKLSITSAGTVDVTVSDGAANDIVQLTTGDVQTSYIPTPTSTPVTRTTSAANTSGNGLQVDLTPEMIDCFGNGGSGTGIGTLIQWVYLPWNLYDLPNDTTINIIATSNSNYNFMFFRIDGSGNKSFRITEGTNTSSFPSSTTSIGLYAYISQWLADESKMRCGRYDPSTGVITWVSWNTYRGYFPIYDNVLRYYYGGTYPISIGGCALYNTILTDDEIIHAAQALQ